MQADLNTEYTPTYFSMRPVDMSNTSKQNIKEYFLNTYNMYETLFYSIKEDGWNVVPDPLRRPIIWYLGHTAALYINKFIDAGLCGNVNQWFEKLFKTGVDPIHSEELDNDVYSQKMPTSTEVWQYRQQVREKVLSVVDEAEIKLPITAEDPIYAILLGCEHERIHYETSTVLIRQMPLKYLEKPKEWKNAPIDNKNEVRNEMIYVPSQTITLGKKEEFPTYGWDNEYGKLTLNVNQFKASKYLISNAEYLEFYKSGAYNQQKYWDTEGWQWKQKVKQEIPLFWVKEGEDIKYRAIFDILEMPLNWPVDVNYHEAKAYANWKGPNFRLIKEGEFNIIRGEQLGRHYQTLKVEADIGAFDTSAGNNNIKYGSSCAVNSQKSSPLGFYDVYGNVWQWGEDYFKPYPGFKTHRLYPDYSGGCFDQKHNLLFGGAWSSTGLSASSFFRVAFRRHFYQNSGFRIVEEIPNKDQQEMYTDSVYLNRYLHFNFATNEEFFSVKSDTFDLDKYESYPVKVAKECLQYFEKVKIQQNPSYNTTSVYEETHALDLGCGMGRTAFELAKKFQKVTGLDYAHGFIDVANELKEQGEKQYTFKKTGDIYEQLTAKVDKEVERERLVFMQGDAMNLPPLMGPFDLIVASNLIDRLYNPMQCLIELQPLLKFDGILIITSPYTWMEEVADKSKWIGGKEGQTTFEALKELMKTLCFELVDEKSLTLLIKEHERKFEFIMPNMTVWKKREFSQEFATSIFTQAKKY